MKKSTWILISVVILCSICGTVIGKRFTTTSRADSPEQWEYLVVSGSNNVNFSSPSSGTLRKDTAGFQREAFVLEQNLDKLGAKGWELVSVSNSGPDQTYYLKRRK